MTKINTRKWLLTAVIVLLCALLAAVAAFTTGSDKRSSLAEGEDAQPIATYILGDAGVSDILANPGEITNYEQISQTGSGDDITRVGWYQENGGEVYHYSLGAFTAGWKAAVIKSVNSTALVAVKLASDWTAVAAGSNNTTFDDGSADSISSYITNGMIYVQANADIRLDLNGKKVDRGLSSKAAVAYGSVIYVTVGGKLEVADSQTGGLITGGNSTGNGGGISSFGDTTLTGGAVSGNNSGKYGGGIYVSTSGSNPNSQLVMTGGVVSNNTAAQFGGGVYASGDFSMSGGEICENNLINNAGGTVCGGGVFFNKNTGTFTMTGGTISNNTAIAGYQGDAYGGGVYIYTGTFEMGGGTNKAVIDGNRTLVPYGTSVSGGYSRAGGLYLKWSQASGYDTSKAFIHNNAEITNNGSYMQRTAGGEYILGVFNSTTDRRNYSIGGGVYNDGTIVMDGGKISGNEAGLSGGIYNNGYYTLSGGEITENTAACMAGGMHATIASSSLGNQSGMKISGDPVIKDNIVLDRENGGLPVEMSDGSTAYASNLGINAGDAYKADIIGKLDEGADIHFLITGKKYGQLKTVGYKEHNSVIKTFDNGNGEVQFSETVDPAKFFHADNGAQVVLTADGEVTYVEKRVESSVGYGQTAESLNGYFKQYTYAPDATLDATLTYDGTQVEPTVKNGAGEPVTGAITDAGIYTLSATVGDVEIAYIVVINPIDITTVQNAVISLVQDDDTAPDTYKYVNGDIIAPAVQSVAYVEDPTVVTVGESNYDVSYEDNGAIGTAKAMITFKNNYVGVLEKEFIIVNADPDARYTAVKWQYLSGGDWADITATTEFVYNGADQSLSVRAALTVRTGSGETLSEPEYVYSAAYTERRSNNYIVKFGGRDEFKNAATYNVTMSGSGNYEFDGVPESAKSVSVAITPFAINVKSADFASEKDGANTKLWYVEYGTDKTTQLLDGKDVSYVVKSGDNYENRTGSEGITDAYARYRGDDVPLNLMLNDAYVANGKTLSAWAAEMKGEDEPTVTVTHTTGTPAAPAILTGVPYEEYAVTTTYIIDLGSNYELADGTRALTLTKVWYIVTIENALRNYDGEEASAPADFVYGVANDAIDSMRPEFGDTVFWTLSHENMHDKLAAVKFVRNASDPAKPIQEFYAATVNNGVYTLGEKLDYDSFGEFFYGLNAGAYTLAGYVPEYRVPENISVLSAWWTDEPVTDTLRTAANTVFAAVRQSFTVNVAAYDLDDEYVTVAITAQTYSGSAIEPTNAINATFVSPVFDEALALVYGVDYTVYFSDNINVTDDAVAVLTGSGNFVGTKTVKFSIIKTQNTWRVTPNIIRWAFGSFDKTVNLFRAQPRFGDVSSIKFKVSTDAAGENAVDGLAEFGVSDNGEVTDEIALLLNALDAGTYYLSSSVAGSDNYNELAPLSMQFNVLKANNYWDVTPSVQSWVTGKYTSAAELISADAHFGDDVRIVIKDTNDEQNIIYDSKAGIDKLKDAKPGVYTVTAFVAGGDSYNELTWSGTFKVLDKVGLPWWGTLLIVLGALAIAAAVLIVLWRTGVFQILTGKIALAIRTRATVDATIAAVRASKIEEESKKSIEEARRKEAAAARRAKAEEERNKPAEEKAAALEEKAEREAARMEKLRAKVEAIKLRAERMRAQAESEETAKEEAAPEETKAEAAATTEAATSENETATASETATTENEAVATEETAATDAPDAE